MGVYKTMSLYNLTSDPPENLCEVSHSVEYHLWEYGRILG